MEPGATKLRQAILLPLVAAVLQSTCCAADGPSKDSGSANKSPRPVNQAHAAAPLLIGNRFLTLNTVVRVRQIEVTRDTAHGPDESSVHTPAEARAFRNAIADAWPGARITWAFSWRAPHVERESYRELRALVVSYHQKFGDEITFIPGAYFAKHV